MVLQDLTEYAEAQSIGTRSVNLFYGITPEDPDALVTFFEYGGLPNEPNLGKQTINLEFPSVQCVVRGLPNDYDTPRQKIQDVVTAFAKVANQSIAVSGIQYKAIMAKQPPFFFKRDANFRIYFIVNFHIDKAYTT